MTLDVASIDTRNATRDARLRSVDFFDAGRYPVITSISKPVTLVDDENVEIGGELTSKGSTRDVVFPVEFARWATTRSVTVGSASMAPSPSTRKSFGLIWNVAPETGGVLFSGKVELTFKVSAIKTS